MVSFTLSAATIALAVGSLAAPRPDDSSPYPNQLIQQKGKLWFGTAIDTIQNVTSDTGYMTIFNDSRIFGQATPANTMKWLYTEPQRNKFDFAPGFETVALAVASNKKVRCHNLVWSSELADFVTSTTWTNQTLINVMRNHITKTIQGFGHSCYSWDVVNEALNGDGTFTNNTFLQYIGPSYVPLAYKFANAAVQSIGGGVKLFYNDYGIENPGPKNDAAVALVKEINSWKGARIDGVGFESHYSTTYYASMAAQQQAMAPLIAEGMDIHITELDVRCDPAPCNSTQLNIQAEAYYETVAACMSVPECRGVTVWDFDDKYSWVPSTFPGQGQADLYYDNLKRHPAYKAVGQAIQGKDCTVCH